MNAWWIAPVCAGLLQAATPAEALLFRCDFEAGARAAEARGARDPVRSERISRPPGHVGQGVGLNPGVIEYPAGANLPAIEGTVACWLQLTSDRRSGDREKENVPVFIWQGTNADTLAINLTADGRQVRASIRSGSAWTVGAAATSAVGRINATTPDWHHLAFTWRFPRCRIHWDGDVVADAELKAVVGRPAPTFRLGGGRGGELESRLVLDELAIFARELNRREIAEISGGGGPPRLAAANYLQQDYLEPARVIPLEVQLRGRLTGDVRLRLQVADLPPMTQPWTDAPIFILDRPMPRGTNLAILRLLDGERLAGAWTNLLVCAPGPDRLP